MERASSLAGIVTDPAHSRPGMLVSLFELIWQWRERARQRRALMALDDRMLSDIGVSRADVEQEAMRPFWQPWSSHGPSRDRNRS